jgi:tetratricopeptide (TPR) repeat protein
LEINDTLADAHTSLAMYLWQHKWDWEGAKKEFETAIRYNPDYATAHHWYAIYLAYMDKGEEAFREIKLAQTKDPLSLIINNDVGEVLYYDSQYKKALEAYQKVLEMDERFWYTHLGLSDAYTELEMYDDALVEIQRAKELHEDWHPGIESHRGIIYARMGREDEARSVLDNLLEQSKQKNILEGLIAGLYFALGDNDEGFNWLYRAKREQSSTIIGLKVFPQWNSIRDDQRFIELLKEVKLDK